MPKKHENILFPQWQGGGILATYEGAMSLKENYLKGVGVVEIPVEKDLPLTVRNKIVGYDPLLRQMRQFASLLQKDAPDTLFVMGGGDDVDILPPAYCNARLDGEMSLMFFDAHGDLNSPDTSPSGNLHGMPLRALLGETDPGIRALMASTLKPAQVVMAGTRDCDPAEVEYIHEKDLVSLKPEIVNQNPKAAADALAEKGHRNVFIHVDIDVIDPSEFPYQPVPAPHGLHEKTFIAALEEIERRFNIVGMCILGYTKMPAGQDPALARLIRMGTSL